MPRLIEGIGPKPAKIMLIGEAPGAEEEFEGKPFVGKSGKLLDDLLLKAGLNRSAMRIDNVVPYRPPDNKMDRLGELNMKASDFYLRLHKEIEETNPNIIIAAGGTALEALTHYDSITKWRGSIIKSAIDMGSKKVIPVVHPAAIFR